ncbi:hypothetical protein B9Z19DRAFT_1086818 [Tuber borchii]|uniref:Uncharacterized protein n=1 Tax=Tuber borchii TaxID=42251 RepID=A0A2T6ZNU0_TUBBO|nr:hypothetical protein B9Z19DRAFT_1086818 [Tuber borchii]
MIIIPPPFYNMSVLCWGSFGECFVYGWVLKFVNGLFYRGFFLLWDCGVIGWVFGEMVFCGLGCLCAWLFCRG